MLRLTGRLVTDPSDASAMNAFDQHERGWSNEVLEAAELDPSLFPEIVASTHVAGTVSARAAEASGLAPGTKVVVGGGDGPMAAVGAGVTRPEDGPYVCLGTSSWISMTSTTPLYDPQKATMTFDHVRPGHFVPTATMQAGGGSLDWISDVLEPGPRHRPLRQAGHRVAAERGSVGRALLPALRARRALAVLEPRCARLLRRALPPPRPGRAHQSGAGGRRVQPAHLHRGVPRDRRRRRVGRRGRRRRGEQRVAAGAGRPVGMRGPAPQRRRRGQQPGRGRHRRGRGSAPSTTSPAAASCPRSPRSSRRTPSATRPTRSSTSGSPRPTTRSRPGSPACAGHWTAREPGRPRATGTVVVTSRSFATADPTPRARAGARRPDGGARRRRATMPPSSRRCCRTPSPGSPAPDRSPSRCSRRPRGSASWRGTASATTPSTSPRPPVTGSG